MLPPSEGKAAGGDHGPVDARALVAPKLAAVRKRVLTAVARTARGDGAAAAAAFKLPPAVVAESLAANREAAKSPTMPALDRYTGVVYAALDPATLSAAGRAAAEESALVFSGLFGVVAGGDLVPAYRVPVASVLPELGALTPVWRAALREVMPVLVGKGFAVDLRSTDYAGMWAPTGPLRHQVLPVRLLTKRPSGPPRVVSYPSKHGKGLLARELVERLGKGAAVSSADDVGEAAAALGWDVETRRTQGSVPALDVVMPPWVPVS
nr:peroxide stress protein YaaA [Motilibacter aurantiacus]